NHGRRRHSEGQSWRKPTKRARDVVSFSSISTTKDGRQDRRELEYADLGPLKTLQMLKAVIIDVSAVARGLLNTLLMDGGYDVVGQAHPCAAGNALLIKHQPQIICISRDVIEADEAGMQAMRKDWPKAMIFMVSSEFDEATIRKGHAMGLNG